MQSGPAFAASLVYSADHFAADGQNVSEQIIIIDSLETVVPGTQI